MKSVIPFARSFLSDSLDVICLKAKMTEQSFLLASVRFLKEPKKAAATHVEKKIHNARRQDLGTRERSESKDTHIELSGGC